MLDYTCRKSIISILILGVCVRVSVISKISGTGCCSTPPLSLKWRSSPGELRRLLLKLTGHVVQVEKPLKLFPGNASNHALYVTMVQYLRNWSSSAPEKGWAFSPSTGMQKS